MSILLEGAQKKRPGDLVTGPGQLRALWLASVPEQSDLFWISPDAWSNARCQKCVFRVDETVLCEMHRAADGPSQHPKMKTCGFVM